MIIIFKRILAIAAVLVMLPIQAFAYDVVNLPESMTFSEALGIYDADTIESATICDLENDEYRSLEMTEIKDFFYAASDMTVWRKINPTPFRGVCINFTTTDGNLISYYFDSGIQIGKYGSENNICYMPANQDTVKLSYIRSQFLDETEGKYGNAKNYDRNTVDFLKRPKAEWAKNAVEIAAANSLLPYEFTNKYGQNITREELAVLMANMMVVTGNYKNMEAYMRDAGVSYRSDVFEDCRGRSDAINQLHALGIVNGRTDNKFDPDGQVTRQELAAFMVRVAEKFMYVWSEYKTTAKDASHIGLWAYFPINWNIDNGIMSVDDSNMFYPIGTVTVEQAIATMERLHSLITR